MTRPTARDDTTIHLRDWRSAYAAFWKRPSISSNGLPLFNVNRSPSPCSSVHFLARRRYVCRLIRFLAVVLAAVGV